ncbi:MAG: DUF2800 domain-containing protein, partial [Actinobacteria bacterium]|nr:DUF2800 domain-containing protein [Actinomycetota bacterium]
MMFDVPTTLSPSRVDSFMSCPLAFRFSSIEKLPDPPSRASVLGTHVHRILELLFEHAPTERTEAAVSAAITQATDELRVDRDFVYLAFDVDKERAFLDEAAQLTRSAVAMQDPSSVD